MHWQIDFFYYFILKTWEDPNHIDESTGCKGDNDPIDVCEIGYRVAKRGDVVQVKVGSYFNYIYEFCIVPTFFIFGICLVILWKV